MRWLLNVSAEKRNSSTGSGVIVRRHGTSAGAGSRRGAWLRSPDFTSSRKTVRRSSSSARPSAPNTQLAGRDAGQEVAGQPRRRQRVALVELRLRAAEGQAQEVGRARMQDVSGDL